MDKKIQIKKWKQEEKESNEERKGRKRKVNLDGKKENAKMKENEGHMNG